MKNKDNIYQKIATQSDFLEKAVASELVRNPAKVKKLLSFFSSEDCRTKHKKVISVVFDSFLGNKDLTTELFKNEIAISEYLSPEYLSDSQLVNLAAEIKKINFASQFFSLLDNTIVNLDIEKVEEIYSSFHSELISLSQKKTGEGWSISDIMVEYEKWQEEYAEKLKNGQKYIGLETGFEDIDKVIDGLQIGHLWVVGAYTSMGKSFFALNIVRELLGQGKRVVYLSLEMSKKQIVDRLISVIAGVRSSDVLRGALFDDEFEAVKEAKEFLRKSKFAVYNEISEIDKIKAMMFEQMFREKVDFFVVDYLGLVTSPKSKTEYETMRDSVKAFQAIGLKLGVPILLLSQVNNEAAKMPHAQLMGFKGAGDIAAAADLALELQSAEKDFYDRERKIMAGEPVFVKAVIKKNRHGRTGVAYLSFDGKTGRFAKMTKQEIESVKNNQ